MEVVAILIMYIFFAYAMGRLLDAALDNWLGKEPGQVNAAGDYSAASKRERSVIYR